MLIPNHRPSVEIVELLLVWFMTYWKKMPRNAAKTVFMWFIGKHYLSNKCLKAITIIFTAALKYELIQPDDINWCYDTFFDCFEIKSLVSFH
jgi:hypothetical protein